MSLMKTLAKVAVGVALAKGASSMMKKGGSSQSAGGGLGGLLGGLLGGAGGTSRAGSAGGLGGLLEQLGGSGGSGGAGGLGGLLGGLAGAGGAGGLLAGMTKAMDQRPASNTSSFGAVLNSQFDATPEPEIEPSQEQEATAALMLAAMIQAAKSDGTFDDAEKDKLLGQLGDVDAQEAAFVQQQLQAPVDIDGLVAQTPQGMGPQVYAMSVLGIDLDTQDEAQYLHQLAQGLGMKPAQVNDIHDQMGVPSLYT